MRAVVLPEFGATPEVVHLRTPEPAEGEVRVRVFAASVNGFDLAVVNGYFKDVLEHRFPLVLGRDFTGQVDAVGPGVKDFQVGDRVFGVVTKAHLGEGSFAEYVTVPTDVGLARLPDGVDVATAAALGLAGTTALTAFEAARIDLGQHVLVVGATGGVGNHLVQLAAKAGAHVVATAGTEHEASHVKDLGAQQVVDPTGDVVAAVREVHPDGVDVVFHLAGDPAAVIGLVRPGGRFVSTLVPAGEQLAEGVETMGIYAHPDRATLQRLSDDIASGSTRVAIQDTFALDDAAAAFTTFASGTLGKLVISIREPATDTA